MCVFILPFGPRVEGGVTDMRLNNCRLSPPLRRWMSPQTSRPPLVHYLRS